MHFLRNRTEQPKKDSAYWLDLTLAALGAICILSSFARTWEWFKNHNPNDRNWGVGLLLAYGLLALLAPRRFNYLLYSLITIVGWGILGAIARQTLLGLLIVLPAASLAYLLLRWKGRVDHP
jgi:hypothetical protein